MIQIRRARVKRKFKAILRTEVILRLDQFTLYAPSEVAATLVSRVKDPDFYKLVRQNLYHMASEREDISSYPDNAILDAERLLPMTKRTAQGKLIVVVPDGEYVKWFGYSWQRQLTKQEKSEYFEERARNERAIIACLSSYLKIKIEEFSRLEPELENSQAFLTVDPAPLRINRGFNSWKLKDFFLVAVAVCAGYFCPDVFEVFSKYSRSQNLNLAIISVFRDTSKNRPLELILRDPMLLTCVPSC